MIVAKSAFDEIFAFVVPCKFEKTDGFIKT
jgi:hypothetical protein